MGRVERARLAAEEPLGEICCAPQIEVADLRPLDADDAEKMSGLDVERPRLARRHDCLADLRQPHARIVVEGRVIDGQPVERVDGDGFGCATLVCVRGRLHLSSVWHGCQV